MSHVTSPTLTPGEIASEIGISVRQLQRQARNGIPGVEPRTDGYHHTYRNCSELQDFIAQRKKFRKGRIPRKKRSVSKRSVSTGDRLVLQARSLRSLLLRHRGQFHRISRNRLERLYRELMACYAAGGEIDRVLARSAV